MPSGFNSGVLAELTESGPLVKIKPVCERPYFYSRHVAEAMHTCTTLTLLRDDVVVVEQKGVAVLPESTPPTPGPTFAKKDGPLSHAADDLFGDRR